MAAKKMPPFMMKKAKAKPMAKCPMPKDEKEPMKAKGKSDFGARMAALRGKGKPAMDDKRPSIGMDKLKKPGKAHAKPHPRHHGKAK